MQTGSDHPDRISARPASRRGRRRLGGPHLVRLAAALATCALTAQLGLTSILTEAAHAAEPRPLEVTGTTKWTGESPTAFGSTIAHDACDVNGDGFDDIIVGSWFWNRAPYKLVGAAYVLWGGKNATGGAVDDPVAAGATRINGPLVEGHTTGFKVGCAHDTNGDGIDDLLVTDDADDQTFVIFGSKTFDGLSLDALGDRGYRIRGAAGSSTGDATGVGDVNGDGLADIAVVSLLADTLGRKDNGRVSIVAGRDDISDVDLENPEPGQVIRTINGEAGASRTLTVARAGDVDGDHREDLLIGAFTTNPSWGGSRPGAAYVVLGGDSSQIDLAADPSTFGFAIHGPKRGRDQLGISVSGAGDLNGDGLDDLLVGSDARSSSGVGNERNGAVAVVFGSASHDTVLTDPTAAAGSPTVFTCGAAADCTRTPASKRGWWLNGAAKDDRFGYDVASVPDLTGDGRRELLVGAFAVSPAPELAQAGAAYLIPGQSGDADLVQVSELTTSTDPTTRALRIDGDHSKLRLGHAVAAIGDFNGDRIPDLAIGGDAGDTDSRGEVFAVSLKGYAGQPTPTPTPTVEPPTPTPTGDPTPTGEPTPTPTGEPTPSPTVEPTPTGDPSPTASATPSPTASPTPSPTPTPQPVTPITTKWQSLGAEKGFLGAPQGPEICTLKGKGCFRVFAGGAIYDSEHSDPQFVRGLIRDRWASMGWENGALGYPVSDEICGLRDKGCVQRFQGGLMYWSPATTAQPVWGEIGKAYASMGWENSVLGYPTGPEFCGLRDNGCAQRFQGGIMYWSPTTGAHPVFGAIGERYAAMGWETSALGYPTSYERCGLKDGGCFQTFSGGSIYFSPKTGAWASWGLIRDHWGRNGWENGRYAYPSGPETCSPNRGVAECRQAYQGGTITWNARRGTF